MLIQPMSDLHIEFDKIGRGCVYTPPFLPTDKDTILVLAGDIDVAGKAINYANALAKRYKGVVLVAGNHDYYGTTLPRLCQEWKDKAKSNVYPLLDSHVMIEDVVFVGGTLWTDYGREDALTMIKASEVMNDYTMVEELTPDMALDRHKCCIEAIQEGLSIPARKHIVVTHMTPSYSNGDPTMYNQYDITKHYYHSNLDWLVPEADMWIFGHTHYGIDREVGDKPTRLISNQRGYSPYALCNDFRGDLVIEI